MTDPKSGIVSCVRKHIFAEDYSVILENDIPVYLRFEIAADSSIIPVSFFGEYPKIIRKKIIMMVVFYIIFTITNQKK